MPRTPEQKIERLEERIKLLESIVLEGKPYIPGAAEYERAIRALIQGDSEPLERYLRHGGAIPGVLEPFQKNGDAAK